MYCHENRKKTRILLPKRWHLAAPARVILPEYQYFSSRYTQLQYTAHLVGPQKRLVPAQRIGADFMYTRYEYGQTSSPQHRCWSSKCKSGTKKRAGLMLVLGMLLFLDGVDWLGWLGIRTTQPPLPSNDMGVPPIIEKHRTALCRYPSTCPKPKL